MFGAVAFSQMTSSKPLAVLVHCPPTNGVFETFFTGPVAPIDGTDDGLEIGRYDRLQDRLRVLQVLGALEHVERDLEQAVREADRLRSTACPWRRCRRRTIPSRSVPSGST